MTRTLDAEIVRRVNDGWDVQERTAERVVFTHALPPHWWEVVLLVVTAPFLGSHTSPYARLTMIVTADTGTLHYRTLAPESPDRRRPFSWEVPNTEPGVQ